MPHTLMDVNITACGKLPLTRVAARMSNEDRCEVDAPVSIVKRVLPPGRIEEER